MPISYNSNNTKEINGLHLARACLSKLKSPKNATQRRMAQRQQVRLLKARFPRLRQLRQEQLGWEIIDILSRLPGAKPSISSIYRLEQGDAIRMSSARRVFDVINGAMEQKLDASKELEASW